MLNRVVVPDRQAGNRFLGSYEKVYKFGLSSACTSTDLFDRPPLCTRTRMSIHMSRAGCVTATEAEGRRELDLIGVLPSLAWGEGWEEA